jgi:hypothetical protein
MISAIPDDVSGGDDGDSGGTSNDEDNSSSVWARERRRAKFLEAYLVQSPLPCDLSIDEAAYHWSSFHNC